MQVDDENKLTEAFERLMKYTLRNSIITDGIISNVRTDTMLVDVTISGQLFQDVPLKVLVGTQPTIIEVPSDQSPCLVCLRNADFTTPQILMIQNVDSYLLNIGKVNYTITSSGFKLVNDSSGLKNTLKNLINAILALTVPTGTGPSGVPINASTFNNILTDLDKYLID